MARPSSADPEGLVELVVHGVSNGGDGVARLADGRVAFVTDAYPGDTVRARLTSQKARFVLADTVEVLTPSPQRVASACAVQGCAGCPMRGYDYAASCASKTDQVLQSFERIAKIDASGVFGAMHAADDPWRYRHRARFHAHYDGQWRLGYHARASHAVLPYDRCVVLWPELEDAVGALAAWLAPKPAAARVREVEVVYSRGDRRAAAAFRSEGELDVGDAPFGDVTLRYDQPRPFAVWFSPRTFTQAHPAMNARLVDAVVDAAVGARVLELHAGIGNFSLALAARGAVVRAVEQNPVSSALATRNAREAGFDGVTTIAMTDAAAVDDADRYDVVLLDPPRVGCREVAERLTARGPRRIVYVSCDPATLARDVGILRDGGYVLTALSAFDMFPQTPHVESLAVLTRSP